VKLHNAFLQMHVVVGVSLRLVPLVTVAPIGADVASRAGSGDSVRPVMPTLSCVVGVGGW
jgi:hypothetical protein